MLPCTPAEFWYTHDREPFDFVNIIRVQGINATATNAPLAEKINSNRALRTLLNAHGIEVPRVDYVMQPILARTEPNTARLLRPDVFDLAQWDAMDEAQRIAAHCTCTDLLACPWNRGRVALPNDYPGVTAANGHLFSSQTAALGPYGALLAHGGDFRPPDNDPREPHETALAALDAAVNEWANRVVTVTCPAYGAILHEAKTAVRVALVAYQRDCTDPSANELDTMRSHRPASRRRVAIMIIDKAPRMMTFACLYVFYDLVANMMHGPGYANVPGATVTSIAGRLILETAQLLQPLNPAGIRGMTVAAALGEVKLTVKVVKQKVRPVIDNSNDVLKGVAEHLHGLLVTVLTILPVLSIVLGRNVSWGVNSSFEWLHTVPDTATAFATCDIQSMFDMCEHNAVFNAVTILTCLAFHLHPGQALVVLRATGGSFRASWRSTACLDPRRHATHYDAHKVLRLTALVLCNAHIAVGGLIFRQICGIPMGSQASPDLAECLVAAAELVFMLQLPADVTPLFDSFRRRADDIAAFNVVPATLERVLNLIYPRPLKAIPADGATGATDNFLDVTVSIDPTTHRVHTRHYRKAAALPFTVHRMPRLGGATPAIRAHGTVTGQFITFYRTCSDRWAFALAVHELTTYLVAQRRYNRRLLLKHYLEFLRPLRNGNRYGAPLHPRALGLTALLHDAHT